MTARVFLYIYRLRRYEKSCHCLRPGPQRLDEYFSLALNLSFDPSRNQATDMKPPRGPTPTSKSAGFEFCYGCPNIRYCLWKLKKG